MEDGSSELMMAFSGTPLAALLGNEGRVGSAGFENSQLSKVAPSPSKSMVAKLSKPSTVGTARARHSSTATDTRIQHQKN